MDFPFPELLLLARSQSSLLHKGSPEQINAVHHSDESKVCSLSRPRFQSLCLWAAYGILLGFLPSFSTSFPIFVVFPETAGCDGRSQAARVLKSGKKRYFVIMEKLCSLLPSLRLEIHAETTRRGLLNPSGSPFRALKPPKPGSSLPSLPQPPCLGSRRADGS